MSEQRRGCRIKRGEQRVLGMRRSDASWAFHDYYYYLFLLYCHKGQRRVADTSPVFFYFLFTLLPQGA